MGLGVRELFDNNIKVHFAGSDGGEIFYAALLAAQTKYRLFSCYKYIPTRAGCSLSVLSSGSIF